MATEGASSLYERLGGVYSIATVIDDFIDRIMVDPRLNANPRVDDAHHRVPPAGFKYLVTEMVCWATGGPQKYTGRSMKDSHQNLMITAAEWEAFLDDLQQTLTSSLCPRPSRQRSKLSLPAHEPILSFKRGWEQHPHLRAAQLRVPRESPTPGLVRPSAGSQQSACLVY